MLSKVFITRIGANLRTFGHREFLSGAQSRPTGRGVGVGQCAQFHQFAGAGFIRVLLQPPAKSLAGLRKLLLPDQHLPFEQPGVLQVRIEFEGNIDLSQGMGGLIKCLLFAFVMVWITGLLEKVNIRLKI